MSGLALALMFGIGWLPLYVFRVEAIRAALPCYTRRERLAIWGSLVALIGHMATTCVLLSFTSVIPPWRAGLALAVFTAGIGFWLWGRLMIGPLRARRLPDEAPARLHQDGAFGIVRHPLYAGVLVAAAAPLVAREATLTAATYLLCIAALIVRVRQEEHRLHAQLGALYATYSRSVKRLVPFVW